MTTQSTNFPWTEEHDLLRKTVRRLLATKSPIATVRQRVTDDSGYDAALWAEMSELGLAGLVLPESVGGAGLDALSMAVVLEEMGRNLCPSPLLGSVLAGIAIGQGGTAEQQQRLLPAIATGSSVATVALTDADGSWEPESVTCRAERDGDDFALSGTKTHVMWGDSANLLVAPFCVDDSRQLFAIELPCKGVSIEREVSIDPTRRTARITFDNAKVSGATRLASGLAAWTATHKFGFALAASELLGGAEAVLAMTRNYAIERFQFDRAIGSFQAVKHPIVNVMIELELARSLLMHALDALDRQQPMADVAARMAKAATTDAFLFACDRGVQLHGGFGFTWDCDVHFYFKRALWGAATLGDSRHHRRVLGDVLKGGHA